MPLNKNALIRYKTLDRCLQNRQRKWTLQDLIHACSETLYEYEGRDINVSKRTVQLDIQMMRSDKLGYNAPIEVYQKKYYRYADEDFKITAIPLTQLDMDVLTESVEMLRQFKDFSLFNELQGVIQKLEDRIYSEKNQQSAIIHIEKNENLKGLHFLDGIYQAILKQIVLRITYQSFKASQASDLVFHPFILKEFNNRWFVVGRKEGQDKIMTLALDRIIQIDYELSIDYQQIDFAADQYYYHTYGVTVLNEASLINIKLKVNSKNAPYILTKPIHHSQQLLEEYPDGSIMITLYVHHNFEIERLILGFANAFEVVAPERLRKRIMQQHRSAYLQYTNPTNSEDT